MMRNCVSRPEPGQHAATPPCRHDPSQANRLVLPSIRGVSKA